MLLCKLSKINVCYKCNMSMIWISCKEPWQEICNEVSNVQCLIFLCITSILRKYHNGNIGQHLHDLCSRIQMKPSLQVSVPDCFGQLLKVVIQSAEFAIDVFYGVHLEFGTTLTWAGLNVNVDFTITGLPGIFSSAHFYLISHFRWFCWNIYFFCVYN